MDQSIILDGLSMNLERANLDKLHAAFPECFIEGKLDIDKLLSLCGEYIDNDFEKYRFEWKGKAECLRLAQKRSTGTLRPCPEDSVNWDTTQNLYIEGDNLEVLKLLQTAYYRKVKMIYIDPPYNTGNDFVYADDFADPLARYKEITAQTTKSNPETMGRFHTNWLNMMYPRLRLAANLLRDDGVIFISVDDNEVDNLKKICSEVFGEENFIANIIWQKVFAPKNSAKYFSGSHEYVLCYAKRADIWTPNLLQRNETANDRYKNPDNDPRGPWTSDNLTARNFYSKGTYSITCPGGRVIDGPPTGTYWRFSKQNLEQLIKENRIYWGPDGNNTPRLKRFLSEVKQGIVPQTLWPHTEVGHTQEAKKELIATVSFSNSADVFDTPKPTRLIERILQIATSPNNDDIVMDFFSGSGTTAHAVMAQNAKDGGNRRFIMVQIPEKIDSQDYSTLCEIGKERIRQAGEKLKEILMKDGGNYRHLANNLPSAERKDINKDGHVFNIPKIPARWSKADESEDNARMADLLDIGFRVFKLDSSNLKTWDATPIDSQVGDVIGELADRMNAMIHRVKPDRSDLDMVFEVMLKLGVPLDFHVSPVSINSKIAYSVGEDCLLLVCLAENIQPEDVEQMAEYAPAKAVISRDSFADDTAMSNAYYILRDRGVELKLV